MVVQYIIQAEFPDRTRPWVPRLQLEGLFDMLNAKAEILDEKVITSEEDSLKIIEYPQLRIVQLEEDETAA